MSFAKGCYLGQEIVARMQYRGALKKRLHRIETATQNRELTSGNIVVAGSHACLAILSNPTEEPVTVTWDDGSLDTATPLGTAESLELKD